MTSLFEQEIGVPTVAISDSEQVDAMIAASVDWRGATLSRLRDLVMSARPAMVEQVKWKKPSRPQGVPVWCSPTGAVVPRRHRLHRCDARERGAVDQQSSEGARLEDSSHLFNARLDSGTVRAVDFGQDEEVHEPDLKKLVAEAAVLNGESARTPRASSGRGRAGGNPTRHAAARHGSDGAGSGLGGGDDPVGDQGIPGGVVHELPPDLHEALDANPAALAVWMDITPLARNEFICWVEDAKRGITRERRIRRTQEELEEGQRRPCCWPGCGHRQRNGSATAS